MLRFQAAESPGKMNRMLRGAGRTCSSCERKWCFNESECASQSVLLSRRKTLAIIAGNHRGSGIYTWIRELKGEDMRAITSAGLSFCWHIHQQGSSRDHTGLVRVIPLTNKDIRGQIVAASSTYGAKEKKRLKIPDLCNYFFQFIFF